MSMLALAEDAVAQAEPWPIKQFEVLNVVPAGHGSLLGLPTPQVPILNDEIRPELAALVRSLFGDGVQVPPELETVPLDPETKLEIENYLTEVAALYEQWGFAAPVLSPVVEDANGRDAFRVYILSGLSMDAAGLYDACRFDNIRVNASSVLRDGRLSDFGAHVLAHELFHAVTWATPFFACDPLAARPGAWIYEGLADAAAADAVRHLRTRSPDLPVEDLWGRRVYAEPLPAPKGRFEADQGETANQYATSSFWRYLAESSDRGAIAGPVHDGADYGFVPPMLAQGPVARECDSRGAVCAAELRWADSHIRRSFGLPLRKMYARFLQAYVQYPEYRPGIDDPFEWRDHSFAGCELVQLNGADGRMGPMLLSERLPSGQIERNAAKCFTLTVSGFDAVNRLLVRAYDPTGRLPIQNLSVVSTQPPYTLPKAKMSVDEGGRPAQSAAWTFEVEQNTPVRLIVTNMADDPGATIPLDGLLLEFTILDEYARLGQSDVDGGDVTDAIDTPLELDMEKFSAIVYPIGQDTAGHALFPAPSDVADPCLLRIQAADDFVPGMFFAESFYINLLTSGPIEPGTYPVLSYEDWTARTGGKGDNPQPVNGVYATAKLHDLPDGDWELRFETGDLTIDTLTRDLVAGRISGVAHNREQNLATGGYEIEHSRTLAADFSIAVRGSFGPYRDPDYPCIGPRPAP